MSMLTVEAVRDFLLNHFSAAIGVKGLITSDVKDDFDLLGAGVVDSMGVIEMISAVEQHFDVRVDFERMDAAELTIIGPFCRFVVKNGVRNGSKA